jgi:hypothetical protein
VNKIKWLSKKIKSYMHLYYSDQWKVLFSSEPLTLKIKSRILLKNIFVAGKKMLMRLKP